MSSPIVILAGARTPIGKLSGSMAPISAPELGGFAIRAALERAGLAGEQVDYIYMGRWSSPAAVVAPAPPRCAGVAARETPS